MRANEFTQPKSAGCIIVAKDTGRWCLQQRSDTVSDPGVWSTWGGGVEPGETLEETVRRELAEEGGYTGKLKLKSLHKTPQYATFVAYVPTEFEPKINHESKDWCWCEKDQLPEPLHPKLKQTLLTLNENDLDEGWRERAIAGALGAAAAFGGYQAVKNLDRPEPVAPQVQRQPTTPKEILLQAAQQAGMSGHELSQFLAQTAHETLNFTRLVEKGTPQYFIKKYENPRKAKILGNKFKGDGELFKGRGFIQLTGRDNYTRVGKALGLDLVNNPNLAADPATAAAIAVWYWKNRVAPKVQDFTDTKAVTKTINPGMKHQQRRQEQFKKYTAQQNENFDDGKNPGRKGLAKRVGVNCKQSVSKLRSIAKNSSGERQRMAHWCANMKSGRNK